MIELAIGEETIIRIKCVEDDVKHYGCQSCCFSMDGNMCRNMNCASEGRTDGKNVHFEIVEDEK